MADAGKGGVVRRFFGWLFSPSARWSVFALVVAGLVVGVVGVIGTQVAVAMTGSDEFCGNACHSHAKFVFPEHKQSAHYNNRTGVRAMCVDCHLPHTYPAKLIAKTKAGVVDMLAEMRGTISTQEKFDKERWRLANLVWDEMKADNSANCRSCHDPRGLGRQEAVRRREEGPQEVQRRQGHLHRVPYRGRSQGTRRAEGRAQGCPRGGSSARAGIGGIELTTRRALHGASRELLTADASTSAVSLLSTTCSGHLKLGFIAIV